MDYLLTLRTQGDRRKPAGGRPVIQKTLRPLSQFIFDKYLSCCHGQIDLKVANCTNIVKTLNDRSIN